MRERQQNIHRPKARRYSSRRRRKPSYVPIYADTNSNMPTEVINPDCDSGYSREIDSCPMPPCLSSAQIVSRGLQFDDIEINNLIGSGGFGAVYEGCYGGRRVAVKRINIFNKNKRAAVESFKAELAALRLKHTNIVRTILASAGDNFSDCAIIVMEYAGDLNLQQVINDSRDPLPRERRITYSLDIANALFYTHDNGIAHLDVKPANVIITPDDRCKLADFGCCQTVQDEIDEGHVSPTQRSYLTGTFAYRAPELLRGDVPTTKADIYSYGVTLWQMLTREQPFAGENQHVVIFGVVAYHLRPSFTTTVLNNMDEAWYVDAIMQCWSPKPEQRPTATKLLEKLSSKTLFKW
uniref:non-specific serine/threonine protein kinase n=1 Tax=Saccoglossus kowalevskii TaxID=10224 RepID=A0ABM0GS94_SACKO|nr:PREDICTED: serine/threonine-protein kinase mos-like [Saccoglossus kowalevskii]